MPDLFADLSLAQRLEGTEGRAGAAFVSARVGKHECAECHGAYLMFDGVDSPLTQTFGLGLFEPATDEILAEIEAFYHRHQSPISHEVCPLAGVALMELLVKRGYSPVETSSVMFLDLAVHRALPALNPGLRVEVAGPDDREIYSETMARGWSDGAELSEQIKDLVQGVSMAVGYTGFLVRRGELPVASGGLFMDRGVALLAGASTVPKARGQGAQRAVLAARLKYAVEYGCTLGMMVTEPGSASQRNGERNSFRIAYTRTKWRRS